MQTLTVAPTVSPTIVPSSAPTIAPTTLSTTTSPTTAPKRNNDSTNDKQAAVITVDEAKGAVIEFCKRPNIGVEASHIIKYDIEVQGTTYYYFDVIYSLLMGDPPSSNDNLPNWVYVSCKDGQLFEIIEEKLNKFSVGKKLTKSKQVLQSACIPTIAQIAIKGLWAEML
ncbi:hypothetical protein [Gorillibacterium massiliense]|uniref:hypothetical protein n=1 Tax=Gorillibacterium massiliense TaxID=1280390 RepID=UPI000594C0CA|nr:hypothetical protein [Gorillibacterium massiliense]